MNEFEWRRQLRDLREPRAPRRDLWAEIDARLDVAADPVATPTLAGRQRWLIAASFAGLCLLAGSIVLRLHSQPQQSITSTPRIDPKMPWQPTDPRLAGAAIELGSAQMELRQAMQQAPDSPALRRLLQRTEQQQSRLRQLEHQAG